MTPAVSTLALAAAALVPYAILQARFLSRLRSAPAVLGAAPGSAGAWRRYVARRAWASVAGAAFWLSCALAASGTARVPRYVSEPVTGAEIVFVVDASNSMLTDEGRGSRLDGAKDFILRLASSAEGAGLSVVAFRGRPVTLCPSTRDRRAFEDALRWAGPSVTSAAGSDVGAALDEAVRPALRAGTVRVVVVASDGNDTGGDATAAAARAAAAGAALAFVGFGGERSLPVLDQDRAPVRGADGAPSRTALDEEAMRAWAAAGRGAFARADEADALARIAAICAGAARAKGLRRDVRVSVDASPLLAGIALASLALALALSAAPRAARPSAAKRRFRA